MIPTLLIIIVVVLASICIYKKILNEQEEQCWGILEDNASTICESIESRMQDNILIMKIISSAMGQEERTQSYDAIAKHLNSIQPMTIFSEIKVLYSDNSLLSQAGILDKKQSLYDYNEISKAGEHMSQ